MKKQEEAFQMLYAVEVKDGKCEPWRVLAAFGGQGEAKKEAEDAACRAIMMERYLEVRMSEWTRKEAAGEGGAE